MDPIARMVAAGAAGAAGGGDPTYVDDVFSTFLYEGNNSTNVINNGIDLSGEGGLVWIKNRQYVFQHVLVDTERGATKYLRSNSDSAEQTAQNTVPSFSSTGFTTGTDNQVNYSASNQNKYTSWTFRKAPGFFDVVTWTGNASGAGSRTLNHSLNGTVGAVLVKCTSDSSDWMVWHRSLSGGYLNLNATRSTQDPSNTYVSSTNSDFTITYDGSYFNYWNGSGRTYVAYLFAHDDQSFGTNGDEAIIKCGSYTSAYPNNTSVNLGFEPQFLLIKRSSNSADWVIYDNMRGVATGSNDAVLRPSSSAAESSGDLIDFTPTGFIAKGTSSFSNYNTGDTFIYMAIRRPHKPPTAGTEVFAAQASRDAADGTPSALTYTSNFPVDLMFNIGRAGNSLNMVAIDRLRGPGYLATSQTDQENPSSPWKLDTNAGVYLNGSYGATSEIGRAHV